MNFPIYRAYQTLWPGGNLAVVAIAREPSGDAVDLQDVARSGGLFSLLGEFKFPVQQEIFPAPRRRTFRRNTLIDRPESRGKNRKTGIYEPKFPVFPPHQGIGPPETSFQQTASSAGTHYS